VIEAGSRPAHRGFVKSTLVDATKAVAAELHPNEGNEPCVLSKVPKVRARRDTEADRSWV